MLVQVPHASADVCAAAALTNAHARADTSTDVHTGAYVADASANSAERPPVGAKKRPPTHSAVSAPL